MRHQDKTIRSIGEALPLLEKQANGNLITWYRGQSSKSWKLVPSLARNPRNLMAENALIKRFMQNAVPHMTKSVQEEWEWIFLMQHHRAPTRLLDWTESPLAALYFAVASGSASPGAVWCLDPVALNREAKINFKFSPEIPAFGRDKTMASYLPSNIEEGSADLNPIAIVGPRNTTRMAAQLGTFTINHRDHKPIETIGAQAHIWRWVIPAKAKARIAKELARLSVTELTLFPDLDRVAKVSTEILL